MKRCLLLLFLLAPIHPLAAQHAPQDQLAELAANAKEAQARKDYRKAAEEYRAMLAIVPHQAEIWANLGLMQHLAGDYPEAVSTFRQALKRNPDLFPAEFFLGVDLLALRSPREALPHLERARGMRPNEPVVLVALGRAQLWMGEVRAANRTFERATELDPRDATAWFGLGDTRFALMRSALEKLGSQPNSPYARALDAQGEEDRGKRDEALQIRSKLPPTFLTAIAAPDCDVSEAGCLFTQKQYRKSLTAAGNALAKDPENPQALYWSVRAAKELALEALRRAAELAPDSVRTHLIAGEIYLEQQNLSQAHAEFARASELDPASHPAAIALARVLEAEGRLDQAVAILTPLLKQTPGDPDGSFVLARILVAQGNYDAALPYARAAVVHPGSGSGERHSLLAKIYEHREDSRAAIAELKQALSEDRDGAYHYRLFRLYQKTHKQAAAEAARREYLLLREKSHSAPNAIANEYLGQALNTAP